MITSRVTSLSSKSSNVKVKIPILIHYSGNLHVTFSLIVAARQLHMEGVLRRTQRCRALTHHLNHQWVGTRT